jgi:FkbM family methyltransferase
MGIDQLLLAIKSLVCDGITSYSDHDACRELSKRLIVYDTDLINILKNDRESLIFSIKILSQSGQKYAVFALLENLNIPHHDTELLEIAINIGLGGDAAVTHLWISKYDIVGQRLEMITTVVIPYLTTTFPGKNLFRDFKLYEANCLMLNRPLIDPLAIYKIISAARDQRPSGLHLTEIAPLKDQSKSVRLILPNLIFNVLLRLSWVNQDYLFDLHDRYNPDEFIQLLKTLEKVVPVYLIPTHLGYPMGGGESFMHQTCRILSEFAVKCVWISFRDPKAGWYNKNSTSYTPYYIDIRCAGGRCRKDLQSTVNAYEPDLIHAQGGTNDLAMEIAKENRCTTMIGYHFWNGLIELGKTGNRHINDNLEEHTLKFSNTKDSKLIWKYVASEFMQDVYTRLGGTEHLNIIHPVSDNAQFFVLRDDPGIYVLQVNVSPLKGGNIFLDGVKALGDKIPFMGILSEPESSDFYTHLSAEIEQHPLCKLNSYGNVRDFYKTARLVIVPTLVDETFCRVAFEAAMNGIPVISTANGYLPYMLGDTGIYLPEDSTVWITTIQDLYHDTSRLKQIGEMQQLRLRSMFDSNFCDFINPAMYLIDNSVTRNIGIFTAWGDQGLGNLSHTHSKLLRSIGYKVHIFSFQPYAAIGKSLVRQSNHKDWSVPGYADSIHYSFNHREEVTAHELCQFILINNIRTLIVPEVCWKPNWERLFAIKSRVPDLLICTIPMIEIVVKEEILNHNNLTSTFYCTRSAENVLNNLGVNNGSFLGHGFGAALSFAHIEEKRLRLAKRNKIRFLHVAGHNPKIRKNTNQVIEAFTQALMLRGDIELTVTSMDPLSSYWSSELPFGITIIDRCLSRDEIMGLYEDHDVSIQVSSHEGLGLGFYESIARSTPVISLHATPHNEIVLQGETGWLIPAQSVNVTDNERAVVEAWSFNTSDLTCQIILLNREEIDRLIVSSGDVFKTRFDEVALVTRFLQVLPHRYTHIRPDCIIKEPEIDAELQHSPSTSSLASQHKDKKGVTLFTKRKKVTLKRILARVIRRFTRLPKTFISSIQFRFRLLLTEANEALRQDVHNIAREQGLMLRKLILDEACHSLNWKLVEITNFVAVSSQSNSVVLAEIETRLNRAALEETEKCTNRAACEQTERDKNLAILAEIRREVEFIKNRIATYAGQDAVLTYTKDESPIFVNTGDLGCPSPIVNGGIWEPENLGVLYSFVTDNTVFLDIGANIGYFSIAIGNRLKRGGKVFAIEPHPTLTNLIERSVQLNGLEEVVKIFQCAASDQQKTLELFYPDDHLGKGSSSLNGNEKGRCLSAQAYRIDDLLPQNLIVDLIKIDVEGDELNVLQGMPEVLRRSPNVKVLFEKLEAFSEKTDKIGHLMRNLGFTFYGVSSHSLLLPLDIDGYQTWVGDVLAAQHGVVDLLSRTGFSVYPGQLSGKGFVDGNVTTYRVEQTGLIFAGPNWYLPQGNWKVKFHGAMSGVLCLVIVQESQTVLSQLKISDDYLQAYFTVVHDITHFEIHAYAESGVTVDLERIEFIQV